MGESRCRKSKCLKGEEKRGGDRVVSGKKKEIGKPGEALVEKVRGGAAGGRRHRHDAARGGESNPPSKRFPPRKNRRKSNHKDPSLHWSLGGHDIGRGEGF